MHRFFITTDQLTGGSVLFRPDQAHQIGRVLRMSAGDEVMILDGTGMAYTVILETVSPNSATGKVTKSFPATGEPQTYLTLYQSLLKRDKFEWVLQKGTEIGVARFVPVITRRTLVRDAETVTADRLVRWRRIIMEAAEQSGRGRLPALAEPQQFATSLTSAATAQRALIAWEGSGGLTVDDALTGLPAAPQVALLIGPEGGYDAEEIAQAEAAGIVAVTLGPRILRTETAAMVGPALILHVLGEMA